MKNQNKFEFGNPYRFLMDDLLLKRRPKKFVQQRKAIQTLTMANQKL